MCQEMNPERAKKVLKIMLNGFIGTDDLDTHCASAYEVAANALDKQIPRKPIWGNAYSDLFIEKLKKLGKTDIAETKTYCCASCGEPLIVSSFVKITHLKTYGKPYCEYCGQAVDWEIENEGTE